MLEARGCELVQILELGADWTFIQAKCLSRNPPRGVFYSVIYHVIYLTADLLVLAHSMAHTCAVTC